MRRALVTLLLAAALVALAPAPTSDAMPEETAPATPPKAPPILTKAEVNILPTLLVVGLQCLWATPQKLTADEARTRHILRELNPPDPDEDDAKVEWDTFALALRHDHIVAYAPATLTGIPDGHVTKVWLSNGTFFFVFESYSKFCRKYLFAQQAMRQLAIAAPRMSLN